jgi:hypothetical protein
MVSQPRRGGHCAFRVIVVNARPMTTRKANIALKSRLTAFVSRESGAAELESLFLRLGRDGGVQNAATAGHVGAQS